MSQTDSNPVLLLLMRLTPNHQQPLRGGETDGTGHWKQLHDESSMLLAGVLDPSERLAAAPVTPIELKGSRLKNYNEILRHVENISNHYYREGGYIDRPDTYTPREQTTLSNQISDVGRHIYDLFSGGGNPVRHWLDKLLESTTEGGRGRGRIGKRPLRPVTIVTNDFSIPWCWMKREIFGPSLCEVCSLGMLQLRAAIGTRDDQRYEMEEAQPKTHRALLINGSSDLPFSNEEIDGLIKHLESPSRVPHTFEVSCVDDAQGLTKLSLEFDSEAQMTNFSGHYSSTDLLSGGKRLPERWLDSFIKDALLVLDGCSSARGLDAWADIEGLTSKLSNPSGAVGCIATVLPIKHDPIVNRVFWSEFYSHLRSRSCSVGYALTQARLALKRHFEEMASPNPTWIFYQLIGSPAVRLVEEGERDE